MVKLHYCMNGASVTDQVIKYQETKDCRDYQLIQWYYDEFREHWYSQLSDYMDRLSFDSDFDYKLAAAVESFSAPKAASIAKKKGYRDSHVRAFNGWFYTILNNWKSNVKTSRFRLKKRPSTQCPVCHRNVPRIDAIHLQHYKTTKDLPKFIVWKGDIYEVCTAIKQYISTWGPKTTAKWRDLQNRDMKPWTDVRRRVRWPWRMPDGERGVLCPFTRKIIPCIDDEYLRGLPDRHSRYARPILWEEFVEEFPRARIQSEIYDLGYLYGSDENTNLADRISHDHKLFSGTEIIDYKAIQNGEWPLEYENAFCIIDSFASNEKDREILKLMASGYSIADIADTLKVKKKEVRECVKVFSENEEMKKKLEEV